MKRFSTWLPGLVLLLGILLVPTNGLAQQPIKRVLLEEFTGAWCPWCVDGPVRLDELHKKFGDQVIAVAIHDNDKMTIPAYSNDDGLKIMAPFFPAGCVNRKFYSDEDSKNVGITRENWMARTAEELAKPAVVDVKIKTSKFDNSTRVFTITVQYDFYAELNGDIRTNVMLVENGVQGTGTGYDQANAYNALAGAESHPYYGKGNPIKGFIHNHVLRELLGGAWGTKGVIPASVKKGDSFTHTYTFTVPAEWKPENMEVVALAQMYNDDKNNREVLNSIGDEFLAGPTRIMSAGGLDVRNPQQQQNYSFSISNRSEKPITYIVTAQKSQRTPQDWSVSLVSNSEVTVPANSIQSLTATLNVGATVGVGDVEVTVRVKDDATQVFSAKPSTVIHGKCGSLELMLGEPKHSIQSSIAASQRNGYWNVAVTSEAMWEALLAMPDLKSVVVNGGDAGALTAKQVEAVRNLSDRGVNVLVTGNGVVGAIDAVDDIAGEFAVGTVVARTYGSGGATFKLRGISGDPITDGMSFDCKLESEQVRVVTITDQSIASPILESSIEPGAAIGLRLQLYNARMVVLPNPNIFTTNKNELIAKVLTWLEANSTTPHGILRANTRNASNQSASANTVDFKEVGVGASRSIPVILRNTGNSELTIKKASWIGGKDDEEVFAIKGISFPTTLAAGESKQMTIDFTPKSTVLEFNTILSLFTTSVNAEEFVLNVNGKGGILNSVEPYRSPSGDVEIILAPNPVVAASTIRLTLASAQQAGIRIIDATGNTVVDLGNAEYAEGTSVIEVPSAQLANGLYRVIVRTATSTTFAPIVVVK
ncbi:MAG: Omp28-related outer membrane protein [Candidatus Kapabacteria bacterium]|nr:Omp28-related outer membrane protein [Candidatus Kapabacteria bacterium]